MKKRKILPPTYFFIILVMGVGLNYLIPIVQLFKSPYRYTAILLILLGIWINIWTDNMYKKNKTTVKPFEKPSSFISEGPFRFSRNPMYLGMLFILIGISFILGSLTSFISPFLFYFIITSIFIPKEEKALEETFGKVFTDYKKEVRCWI